MPVTQTNGTNQNVVRVFEGNRAVPDTVPCFSLRPNDVDFQTFDLIAVYKLDGRGTPGVETVTGSTSYQKAYRLGPKANLTLPLSKVFPKGMPEQFSLVGTFHTRGQSRRWSLLRAKSPAPEFSLSLIPRTKHLVVYIGGARTAFYTEEAS
ncbi:Collagen alpha-1(IX) chain [Eumeta japonica]|uniref:Collagen alpha-1(IX) chain n=1 Tax=Eumeta variegata TaxID=151549 RepID=A0A4C1VCX9_EUMVA|nr:Collagen alpha-1(IX) chain [Eumeta japonica]